MADQPTEIRPSAPRRRALSHDFGGRPGLWAIDPPWTSRATGEAACHWPAAWRPIAVAILDLPVPVRDEPAAVSGEIAA